MKQEMTNTIDNNENGFDIIGIQSSVGYNLQDGIVNELNGLNRDSLIRIGEYVDGNNIEDIAISTTFEKGSEIVLSYVLNDEFSNKEQLNKDYLQLKDLLNQLKEKANGQNVDWILLSSEFDPTVGVSLAFSI